MIHSIIIDQLNKFRQIFNEKCVLNLKTKYHTIKYNERVLSENISIVLKPIYS